MNITDEMLNKLEKLSALSVPADKREEFKGQLSQIVGFVEVLDELDLNGIEAEVSAIKSSGPLRADEVHESEVIKDILKHAPKINGNFFEVPKIID